MTISEPTTSIFTDGEPVTLIVPPRIQAMISGVDQIECAHPRYRLNYCDGTKEEAILEGEAPTEFFAIVSAVQSKRP